MIGSFRTETRERFARMASLAGAVVLSLSCGGTTGREGLPDEADDALDAGDGRVLDAAPVDASRRHRDASPLEASLPDVGLGDDDEDAAVDAGPWRLDTAACDACMSANAAANGIAYPPCSGLSGVATDGPSAGVARVDLCEAVYGCIERTACHAEGTASPCYCGAAQGATCLNPGAANGPCKAVIEAGEETTDPSAIVTGFGNAALGTGAAITALQCALDNCFDTCVAPLARDASARP